MSVTDILREVDERMYEQKRQYHMQQGKESVLAAAEAQWRLLKPEAFDYDQQYLYDALVESTDNYLYVCDMATNLSTITTVILYFSFTLRISLVISFCSPSLE